MSASATALMWLRRTGWLIALWLASIGTLAAIALAFRLLMSAAGLTP